MTADLASLLLDAATKMAYYWIDDVYVTGFAAKQVAGVKHVQLPKQNPIRGYTCPPACMKKNQRWFMHTLQRVEMLQSYYRPLKEAGGVVEPASSNCALSVVVRAKKQPVKSIGAKPFHG